MPIYSFVCTNCGKTDDVLRKVDERHAPHSCQACGLATVPKLVYANLPSGQPNLNIESSAEIVGRTTRPTSTAITIGSPGADGGEYVMSKCKIENYDVGLDIHKDVEHTIEGTQFKKVGIGIKVNPAGGGSVVKAAT
jgi:putative FmdB family regulatory protein